MAVITPSTDLYLLKVPLEIDEMNQLDFANATAQYNYFSTLPKITVDDFTYQRKDYTIRFPALYDDIITYNYVMYRNDAYSNKWFYAFITDMQYINDNMTMITIKNDPWQCWQFDLTYKPCLIEREHANTDNPGDNTLPEGLELGEMVTNGATENFGLMSAQNDFITVVDVTMMDNPGTNQTLSYSFDPPFNYDLRPAINGIPSGVIHIIVGYSSNSSKLTDVIDVYNYAGLSDAIINCYILPKNIIDSTYVYENLSIVGKSTPTDPNPKTASGLTILAETYLQKDISTKSFTKPTTVNGYTPKNKKLLTYPFCYFNVSNNAGTSISYHYEDFSTVSFKTEATFCPAGNVKAIPQNYKNIASTSNAYDYSITGGKYPIISWNSDSYTNWLTQNAVNMDVQMKREIIGAGVDVIGGALRGAIAGGFGGAALGIAAGMVTGGTSIYNVAKEQMLAKTQANLTPDQVRGNINAGDIVWSKMRSNYTYIPMSIKAQYARCADDYFSMFGYATNRVKVPNITGRRNWNYVKTVGCYIDGDIPQTDLQEIKNMFDRGFTIWHNASNFGNYSVNNDIIV